MKSKQLRKWALGAEIVSAIAVIITIGFLAVQMKDNTNALRAQMYQELMRDLNDWRVMVNDPVQSKLLEKHRAVGWDSLSLAEKQQSGLPTLTLFGIYESAYFANQRGVLGAGEWARFPSAICRQFSRNTDLWKAEGLTPMRELFTPEFAGYIDRTCN
jgi:hypothetical protein